MKSVWPFRFALSAFVTAASLAAFVFHVESPSRLAALRTVPHGVGPHVRQILREFVVRDATVADAIKQLSQQSGVAILDEWNVQWRIRSDTSVLVNTDLKDVSVLGALDVILSQSGNAGYTVEGDTIRLITRRTRPASPPDPGPQVVRMYDLRPVLSVSWSPPKARIYEPSLYLELDGADSRIEPNVAVLKNVPAPLRRRVYWVGEWLDEAGVTITAYFQGRVFVLATEREHRQLARRFHELQRDLDEQAERAGARE